MKIICDTNIFLDVFLKQMPFAIDSAKILLLSNSETWEIYIPASSVTDIFYIVANRTHNKEKAYQAVGAVLSMAKICPITEKEIYVAYQRHAYDFEDCLINVFRAGRISHGVLHKYAENY